MSETATVPRVLPVTGSNDSPAVFRRGWLPDGEVFPELAEARTELARLETERRAAQAAVFEIEQRTEAVQEQRRQDMQEAVRLGKPSPSAEPTERVEAELALATEHRKAVLAVYVEQLNKIIGLVVERSDEWQQQITDGEAELEAEWHRLQRQAEAVRAQKGQGRRLAYWLTRTVQGATVEGLYHIGYSELPAGKDPQEVSEDEYKTWQAAHTETPPVTDEHQELMEAYVESGPQQDPQLNEGALELDDDELVDWLMGCGRFDSQPKPEAGHVVAAAEGQRDKAERLLAAERLARDVPRETVVQQLNQIIQTGE